MNTDQMVAAWTKTRSQEIVGSRYVRAEIRKRMSGYNAFQRLPDTERKAVLGLVLSCAWLKTTNGQTVGSVVRDAKDVALMRTLRDL